MLASEACQELWLRKMLASEACQELWLRKMLAIETYEEMWFRKIVASETYEEMRFRKFLSSEACEEMLFRKTLSSEAYEEMWFRKMLASETYEGMLCIGDAETAATSMPSQQGAVHTNDNMSIVPIEHFSSLATPYHLLDIIVNGLATRYPRMLATVMYQRSGYRPGGMRGAIK